MLRKGKKCLLHYGTRRVNLVTNPVISHEMRKGPGSVYDKCNISVVICAYDKCNISVVICAYDKCNISVAIVEQALLTLPEHLSSAPVFSGVRVTRSLALCVCFVDCCLSFSVIVLSVSYLRFTDSDYPVGILDLRILITPLAS
jgi:hypothetical protein